MTSHLIPLEEAYKDAKAKGVNPALVIGYTADNTMYISVSSTESKKEAIEILRHARALLVLDEAVDVCNSVKRESTWRFGK